MDPVAGRRKGPEADKPTYYGRRAREVIRAVKRVAIPVFAGPGTQDRSPTSSPCRPSWMATWGAPPGSATAR